MGILRKKQAMKKIKNYLGIDISAESFSASCINNPENIVFTSKDFNNNLQGFDEFNDFLSKNDIKPEETIICMEATGVYCENLCYYLASKGYTICVEAPHKIKNKTKDTPRKNDHFDALLIAEYAYRYFDKLTIWNPQNQILEQIKVLLSTREHLSKQLIANKNALHTLKYKYYQTPLANQVYQRTIEELEKHIKQIEEEIKRLIDKDDYFKNKISLAMTVPGVGLLLASELLVLTEGFTKHLNFREIAAYCGICPYEQTSGTSLKKPPKSKRCGPARLRKLLYLASLSVRTHNKHFREYFEKKVSEGKVDLVVINNIKNKLLKVTVAVIKSGVAYMDNFVSIKPGVFMT